jgi:TonB family protein
VLAALFTMLAPVPASAEQTFIDAVELIRANRNKEAVALLQSLAERGDTRAQYLLGLAYIEGKLTPRDLVLGYAWLQVAAAGYDGKSKRGAADDAQSVMLKVGPELPGATLIQAERTATELIKARDERLEAATQRATLALRSPATSTGQVLSGCAMEPTLGRCTPVEVASTDMQRCTGDVVIPEVMPSSQGPTASIFQPEYPKEARRRIEDGTAVVLAHIDRSGYVCRVTLVQGSGVADIDDETLKAVRRWRFTPGMRGGEPVEALYKFAVTFRLDGMDFD